jgi:hypothetical protein
MPLTSTTGINTWNFGQNSILSSRLPFGQVRKEHFKLIKIYKIHFRQFLLQLLDRSQAETLQTCRQYHAQEGHNWLSGTEKLPIAFHQERTSQENSARNSVSPRLIFIVDKSFQFSIHRTN